MDKVNEIKGLRIFRPHRLWFAVKRTTTRERGAPMKKGRTKPPLRPRLAGVQAE